MRLALVFAVFLSAAASSASTGEQVPGADIKIDVGLVNLNVRVMDRSGHPVANLRREDFQVFEDGIRQTVSHFQPVTAPIRQVLLLDLSGSTFARMEIIMRAASRFVDALGPDDNIALASFSQRLNLVSDFTRDRSLLKKGIRSLQNKGTLTRFYDAMWSTLDLLDRVQVSRKAIIVMTDGLDNSLMDPQKWPAQHTFQELSRRVAEGDSVIYPVYLNTELDLPYPLKKTIHRAYTKAFEQIAGLAQQSGGTLLKAGRIEDLEKAYQQVASELRTTYSLAYSPIDPARNGAWRRIEVKVDHHGVTVKTRPGYYAR